MTKRGRPTRLGGEFRKPVERQEPRKIEDKATGELRDSIVDTVRLELMGEAYRVDRPTQVKRELFLLEVEKLEPEAARKFGRGVLGSLYDDVLPLYKADDYAGYNKALDEWQVRWNIKAPWVRDAAVTTLEAWQEGWTEPGYYRGNALEWQMSLGEGGGSWKSDTTTTRKLLGGSPEYFVCDPFGAGLAKVEVEFAAWRETQRQRFDAWLNSQNGRVKAAGTRGIPLYDPFNESRDEAEARFAAWIEQLERRYRIYLDAEEQRAKKAGGRRTEETRQHEKFWWLARSRVLGWDDSTILERQRKKDGQIAERRRRLGIRNQLVRQQTRNARYSELKRDYHRRAPELKDGKHLEELEDDAVRKSNERLAGEIGLS